MNPDPGTTAWGASTITGDTVLPAWLAAQAEVLSGETSMDYLARHSHSFRYAARFLPPPYDRLIADVYAFCRFTDDLVDGDTVTPAAELRVRLDHWRALARRAHGGRPTGFALLDRPLMEMGRRGIPFEYASELISGVGMDLDGRPGRDAHTVTASRRYATLAELDLYSYRVASVVGVWLTRLVGVHEASVLQRAADLGHAMQLTNILRDVGEDWRNGRLYLPLDVLSRHGITEGDIDRAAKGEGPMPHGWASVVEELMEAADARYARSLDAVRALPTFFRTPVTISGLVYRDIHTAIRRNRYDNLTQRAHTSGVRKLWLGVKARAWLARPARPAAAGLVMPPRPARAVAGIASALILGPMLALASTTEIPGLEDVATRARLEIARVDAALETSTNGALHLRKLRALYAASVHDASLLPAARDAVAAAQSVGGSEAINNPSEGSRDWAALALGYRGALDVVEARHASWPPARLKALNRGLARLDDAVRRAPEDADLRYLRLTSTYYLPVLLRRDDRVREDFKALAALLPRVSGAYPAEWYVPVADFVLGNAPLTRDERNRLRAARARAATTPHG